MQSNCHRHHGGCVLFSGACQVGLTVNGLNMALIADCSFQWSLYS